MTDLVLGINDPWHDSSFCIYSEGIKRHFELKRFTRRKYELTHPLVGFADLWYPHHGLSGIRSIAIEEGEFLAPAVRILLSSGSAGVDEFVETIINHGFGSLNFAQYFTPTRNEINNLREIEKIRLGGRGSQVLWPPPLSCGQCLLLLTLQ